MRKASLIALTILHLIFGSNLQANSGHPTLTITPAEVTAIRSDLSQIPMFDQTLQSIRATVEAEIEQGIDVPVPEHYSGGYTHTRHKKNYVVAQQAGMLFLISGDHRYAQYVEDMLLQYAALYKDLPLHPKTRSYARGKLFWQCLNDANWLLYMSQAYDAIYNYLEPAKRDILETQLFRPFADHISIASPQFFNRIHNHSTWGTAAVGMIGLVMGDDDLVQRALYGLPIGDYGDARDDDGGFIRPAGQKAGFLANLDSAFSPDGFYTEGPYYQRYAMYPFLIFAQSLRNSHYREQAFQRNDGVLIRAVNALIQLSDKDGEFFPFNDAQKGMSLRAAELIAAVDIAYQVSRDRRLLSIAREQSRVQLDGSGYAVAKAIAQGREQPFTKTSALLRDGRDGSEGGIAILRTPNESMTATLKFTGQGLSHGHYDKLSITLFERGNEVLQDYGMVRFVNVSPKGGGNYLAENTTWAKQSVAHNTLVINETSHFAGSYESASQHHSELLFFDTHNPNAQVVSAIERNAYDFASFQRTLALIEVPQINAPFILDVLEVQSQQEAQYDLPLHFHGQLIDSNMVLRRSESVPVFGHNHGYQHLFVEAMATPDPAVANSKLSWLNNNQFFTLTYAHQPGDRLFLTRLGANDPEFNLRPDPSLVIRRKSKKAVFLTAVEHHGSYSPITELAQGARSNIAEISLKTNTEHYLVVQITTTDGRYWRLFVAKGGDATSHHSLKIDDQTFAWQGHTNFRQIGADLPDHAKFAATLERG